MKEKILELLKQGVSHNNIAQQLGCAKSTISYHANKNGYGKPYTQVAKPKIKKCKICDTLVADNRTFCSHACRAKSARLHGKTRDSNGNVTKHRKQRILEWQQKQTRLAKQYLLGKCSICGYDRCTAALEFHHVDPNEKQYSIAHSKKAFESLKPELDKCILVCSNCHREIHHGCDIKINT